MKYTKPPLNYEAQADLLLGRGLVGEKQLIIHRLSVVNYYRLSGYWYPFRNLPGDDFREGTTFDEIWRRYAFDRRLRCLVIDGIERFEIACRAWLAYYHAHRAGDPFSYAEDAASLPGLRTDDRNRFLADLADRLEDSKESFAEHFKVKYGRDHAYMPVWMASEIMTFGQMVTLFRGSPQDVKRSVASHLGVHDKVVFSWLLALNTIRNTCAHHSRLWNRGLRTKPLIPAAEKKHPEWHAPASVPNNRMFSILTIIKYCLDKVAPQSCWKDRFEGLLTEYPGIPHRSMGFPDNWRDYAIWA